MDNEGQNKNPGNNSGAQGIFSTPELTVDTEKITPGANSENDKSRVASIFANTDDGQRAQKLNNAMESPAEAETADIVIDSGAKKKSKMPIIMAIAVLIVIAIGLVTFAVSKIGGGGGDEVAKVPTTAKEAFEDYRNYLVNGPEGAENTTGEWFLIALYDEDLLDVEEKTNYVNTLRAKFNTYYDMINKTDETEIYDNLLGIVVNGASLDVLSNELLETYTQGGKDGAQKYISNIAPEIKKAPNLAINMSVSVRDFLKQQLNLIEIYDSFNCIENNMILYSCGKDEGLQSATLMNVRKNQSASMQSISQLFPNVANILVEMTNDFNNSIRGTDNA